MMLLDEQIEQDKDNFDKDVQGHVQNTYTKPMNV